MEKTLELPAASDNGTTISAPCPLRPKPGVAIVVREEPPAVSGLLQMVWSPQDHWRYPVARVVALGGDTVSPSGQELTTAAQVGDRILLDGGTNTRVEDAQGVQYEPVMYEFISCVVDPDAWLAMAKPREDRS